MVNNTESMDLGKATKPRQKTAQHIPSRVQADTLFTFTTQLDHIITTISNSMISPRYCVEDLSYLKIRGIKKMAYPMKCFCDINMHKLDDHLAWYGHYGLAFSKEWGMRNKIQPIQYINPDSHLCKDFSTAFSAALRADTTKETIVQAKMKSYLLHQLMYYKPYSGKIANRNTGKVQKKCFTDECEWRYIPDVTIAGFEQIYYDSSIINAGDLREISNAMSGIAEISLKYDYSDLKYIIIKSTEDFRILTGAITALSLQPAIEHELMSKIIVWDNSKGDF